MLNDSIELSKAIKIRTAMEEYQDTLYLSMIRNINSECQDILSDDLGSEFVKNCGRDLAGEVVRNCFNTSEFNLEPWHTGQVFSTIKLSIQSLIHPDSVSKYLLSKLVIIPS